METEKMIRLSAALPDMKDIMILYIPVEATQSFFRKAYKHCWSGILGGRKTVSAQVCLALEQGQQRSVARMEDFRR